MDISITVEYAKMTNIIRKISSQQSI